MIGGLGSWLELFEDLPELGLIKHRRMSRSRLKRHGLRCLIVSHSGTLLLRVVEMVEAGLVLSC